MMESDTARSVEVLDSIPVVKAAKCLFGPRLSRRRRLVTDRDLMHKVKQPEIDKRINDRIGNFYPVRVFWLLVRKLASSGFCTYSFVKEAVTAVNDKSKYETDVLKEAVREFQTKVDPVIDSAVLFQAILFALRTVFGSHLPIFKPELSFERLMNAVNWGANSGYPECTKKETLRTEYGSKLKEWLHGSWTLKDYLHYPCLVFNRVQAKAGKLKRRAVYGYPFLFSLVEQVFYIPVLAWLGSNETILVGKTQLDISKLVSGHGGSHVYSLDYRRFDQRVDSFWIYLVYDLIELLLRLTSREREELNCIRKYFAFSRIFHPLIGLVNRERGVPSGSGGTNLVDSFVNLFVTSYLLVRANAHNKVVKLLIHGDDVVIVTSSPINIKILQRDATKLGMEITFSDDLYSPPGVSKVHFLGSLWCDGKPQRDLDTMCLQAVVLSGALPWHDDVRDAMEGRVYTIFGYDSRLPFFWRRLGFRPYIGRDIFLYTEGTSFQSRKAGLPPPRPQFVKGEAEPWRTR